MRAIRRSSLFLLLAGALAASTVLPVNFARLSRSAHHVVAGRVTSITADKDPATGYIFSKVTLSVSEAVPSFLVGREYSFRMIGGELDGKRLYIAGFPRFQQGEKVVLFLNSQTSSVFGPTIGLWQGVFFVEEDASTGAEAVTDYQRRPIIGVRDRQLLCGRPGRRCLAPISPSEAERQAVLPQTASAQANSSNRSASTGPCPWLEFPPGSRRGFPV